MYRGKNFQFKSPMLKFQLGTQGFFNMSEIKKHPRHPVPL